MTPIYQWAGGIAATAAILGGDYALGHHAGATSERAAQASRLASAQKIVAKVQVSGVAISDRLHGALEARTSYIKTRTAILVQKVPAYVTPEDDRLCIVPPGAVSLLNDATGVPQVPAASGGPDAPAPAVPLSAIVGTGVENLGIGNQWREEALTWRSWYAAQVALWPVR